MFHFKIEERSDRTDERCVVVVTLVTRQMCCELAMLAMCYHLDSGGPRVCLCVCVFVHAHAQLV